MHYFATVFSTKVKTCSENEREARTDSRPSQQSMKTRMCSEKSVTTTSTEMIQIEGVNMRVSANS